MQQNFIQVLMYTLSHGFHKKCERISHKLKVSVFFCSVTNYIFSAKIPATHKILERFRQNNGGCSRQ